jgi:hypothetical protein
MNKRRSFFRQFWGVLALFALVIGLVAILEWTRVAAPPEGMTATVSVSPGIPLAYPPPVTATPTAIPTATSPAYPPPGGQGMTQPETPMPSLTPTTTPWPVSALPLLKAYPTPGPFSGMHVMYTKPDPPGIYTIKVDGTGEIALPPWPQEQINGVDTNLFRISPNGSKILYTLANDMERDISSIWTMNPDGSEKSLLVDSTGQFSSGNCFPEDAIWSPDGARIAYRRLCLSSNEEGKIVGSRQLWLMDANGANQRLLLDDPVLDEIEGGTYAQVFRWQRNGYIYFANRARQLFVVNPENGALYRVMDNVEALDLRSALSPDGLHIKVSPELTTMAVQQAGMTPIETSGNLVGWSVDGLRIIYQDDAGTWLYDLSSSENHLILPYQAGQDIRVHGISPDNRFVAYQTNEGLFILDLDIDGSEGWLIVSNPNNLPPSGGAIHFINWIPIP